MRQLDEWELRFCLQSTGDAGVTEEEARGILDQAVAFAEQRGRGIGGGYRKDGGRYQFAFGFCVATEPAPIPESEAHELLDALIERAARVGLSIADASVDAFEEMDDPEKALAELIREAEDLVRRIN
jgi:hypothetical protein